MSVFPHPTRLSLFAYGNGNSVSFTFTPPISTFTASSTTLPLNRLLRLIIRNSAVEKRRQRKRMIISLVEWFFKNYCISVFWLRWDYVWLGMGLGAFWEVEGYVWFLFVWVLVCFCFVWVLVSICLIWVLVSFCLLSVFISFYLVSVFFSFFMTSVYFYFCLI